MRSNNSTRAVIIGSGWGGVWSALGAMRALQEANRKDVEVVVIAPEPNLLVRVRLYESDISSVNPSVKELFDAVGVRYVRGCVSQVRHIEHQVLYSDPASPDQTQSLTYDRLVLASGSKVVKPNIPGLELAFEIDNHAAAIRLDEHLRSLRSKPSSSARNTIVIGGAGFTGIEVATEMPSRLRAIFGDEGFNVIMIERNASIGPDLGPAPRPVIEKALKDLGIVYHTGESIAAVEEHAVITSSGRRIETNTCIWTAGVQASDLTAQLVGGKWDMNGRLHVDKHLQVEGVKDILAAGDTARALADEDGHYTFMTCQHAIPMGKVAGTNAVKDILRLPLVTYSQPFYTTCIDLGEWGAVLTKGWDREIWMQGAEAKEVKQAISTEVIYPPLDRETAIALANPALRGVVQDGKYVFVELA